MAGEQYQPDGVIGAGSWRLPSLPKLLLLLLCISRKEFFETGKMRAQWGGGDLCMGCVLLEEEGGGDGRSIAAETCIIVPPGAALIRRTHWCKQPGRDNRLLQHPISMCPRLGMMPSSFDIMLSKMTSKGEAVKDPLRTDQITAYRSLLLPYIVRIYYVVRQFWLRNVLSCSI